jgi:cysteine protease ATG4
MTSNGLQRVVELFWNKPLDNKDHVNPIVVLGSTYMSHIRQEQEGLEDETPSAVNEGDAEPSMSDIKQYFQGFMFVKREKSNQDDLWPEDFLSDVVSRIWLTYRTRFPPLARDEDGPSPLSLHNLLRGQNYDLHSDYFTTDCGWGCMIRTGQTMLANALLHLHLGRDWRYQPEQSSDKHDEIVSWFVDQPSRPFSIHNIVQKGRVLSGKKAGEWFGPSAAARSIQALCSEFDAGLQVFIGSDSGDIYEQDLFKVIKGDGGAFRPTLVLLGVRLGIDNVNILYWQSLKDLLGSSESVGIAGGRPSSSHYFFGYQGDYLFYLDPHIPQPALKDDDLDQSISESTEAVSRLDTTTVHTNKIRKIHLSEIDPSMLLGFLIKSEDEWEEWKKKIQNPDSKNKIVHISPDENPETLSNRKPSFVVYDENGDDFVDVGLEYDDIPEQQEDFEESGIVSDDAADDSTDPVIIDSTDAPIVNIPINRSSAEIPPSLDRGIGSYVECSEFVKDDYGNILTAQSNAAFDDATTVEVESLKQEDPIVVEKEDAGQTAVFEEDWDLPEESKYQ